MRREDRATSREEALNLLERAVYGVLSIASVLLETAYISTAPLKDARSKTSARTNASPSAWLGK